MEGSNSVQIIPYYAHPHVHTVIYDNSFYEETVASATDPENLPYATAVVAGTDSGIDNTFVRLSNLTTKQNIFGKGNFSKYGQSSIQADVLFNGQTNVWFCRVLPENATYSNMVILAHYRKGAILDDLNQETGLYRMEVKYSLAYANKPYVTDGAKTDTDIEAFAESLRSATADPLTGYMTVPVCYVRSIGRGQYGNAYSMSIARDVDAEKDYNVKMYRFNLLSNSSITSVINIFSGSLYNSVSYNTSTLIDDVLDKFTLGSVPIHIKTFEDSIDTLYSYYSDNIVIPNGAYLSLAHGTEEQLADQLFAEQMAEGEFDPLFGIRLNSRLNESIPYYKNYTVNSSGAYVPPDLTIPDTAGSYKPLNTIDWPTAFIGARVLVIADPLHRGVRWLYTVEAIDSTTGNIIYDEGVEIEIDADQYDGINISTQAGNLLSGGHDGDFQEISVNGVSRKPTSAEMKLLLAKEQVSAFRGLKDRRILSPSRINIDFLFDANYNLVGDSMSLDTTSLSLYSQSTILTDTEANQLAILGESNLVLDLQDVNVKRAMYDLNEFRNRNGMTINLEEGAGSLLYLDCNLTGLKTVGVNTELLDMINAFTDFTGRQTVIDLGYYDIYDPTTGRKIQVTTSYFLAQNLVNHIIRQGLNKPFTYNYAQLQAFQNDSSLITSGNMIRDSFKPEIDLIDWDVKEDLYKSRINYYITTDEGRTVQRAVQNTRQLDASALLEESNVRVLNTFKKQMEKACRSYLFEWNDPVVRKGYTDAQMKIYEPWIGTMVEDLDIRFEANEWEQERMIMHCYAVIKFRDIVKRIILEINIQRPDYTGGDQ